MSLIWEGGLDPARPEYTRSISADPATLEERAEKLADVIGRKLGWRQSKRCCLCSGTGEVQSGMSEAYGFGGETYREPNYIQCPRCDGVGFRYGDGGKG